MKKIVTLTFLFFGLNLFSQIVLSPLRDTISFQPKISFQGDLNYAAHYLHRSFTDRILFGGNISEEFIQEQSNRLKDRNSMGFAANSEITYLFDKKIKDSFGLALKIGGSGFSSLFYSQNSFKTIFQGNSVFTTDSVNLIPITANADIFQKIGAGIISKDKASSLFFNFVNLSSLARASFSSLSLIQNETFDSIGYMANGYLELAQGKGFSKGFGFCLDFKKHIRIENLPKVYVLVEIQNLGIVRVNKLQEYSFNKNFSYSGFTLAQILNNRFPQNNEAVLDTLGVTITEKSAWKSMPTSVSLSKQAMLHLPQRLQWIAGLNFVPTRIVTPYFFAGVHARIIPGLFLAGHVSKGQFATYRGALHCTWVKNKLQIDAGTNDLIGMISSKGFGRAIYLKTSWYL